MSLWSWIADATYGVVWIDPELERNAERARADYSHPVAVAERALDERIRQHLANWRPREKARHRFNPQDWKCDDCGVDRVANASVPCGYGIPCRKK